jgi:hypothetical protein
LGERDVSGWGRWSSAADELVSYRYLGCRSVAVDATHATGNMALRSDMRWRGGVLGTPLAIAMLDTAGINIDGVRFGALVHVALHVHEAAAGVRAVRVDGEVPRLARRAIFTECVIADADDPDRVLAHGSADWISLGEVGRAWTYTDPGPGAADEPPMPALIAAYSVVPGGGGTYRIPTLHPGIGDQLLHHGPLLLALEWQAKGLADEAAAGAPLELRAFDVRLMRGGTEPPFVTRVRGAGSLGDGVWAGAELIDARGDVLARIHTVYQRAHEVPRT